MRNNRRKKQNILFKHTENSLSGRTKQSNRQFDMRALEHLDQTFSGNTMNKNVF